MLAEVPVRYLKFLKTDALVPPGRHAGVQVRAGRAAAGPPLRARDPGLAAAAPRLGASRGPGGPLPAGAQPAAHRAAGHREDAPREAHRGAAAGGRRRGAAGLENPLRGAELGAGSADRRPLGAPHGAQRPLPARLAGDRGGHSDGHRPLGRCGLRGAGSRRAVPAHRRFPAAAGGAGQLRRGPR